VEIIVTHDMADFDALAAAVAASKLHPRASIVLGRRMGREVREYLALHKDRFRTLAHGDVEPEQVTHLIAVDVRKKSRLADYAAIVERAERGGVFVTVYDHHPASDEDVEAGFELTAPVGSATTLLVERIVEQKVPVDEVEATLFALGIHADTGSLTYASTNARDARALGFLLDRGASQTVLARYLQPGFSAEQRGVLGVAIDAVEVEHVGHLEIGWLEETLPRGVDGLAEVVSELTALGAYAALFAVFDIAGKRVQVIARSRSPLVDVAEILGQVGGGGHAQAASASLRGVEARDIANELRELVRARPPAARRVAELMSSPVHAISPHMPLSRLSRSLAVWRHTGVPVVDDGKLVGIVSHRDVERAERDGRLDLPVSSCMSQDVKTVDADVSPEQALELMQALDVGRLPVVREGRVVGIVTRSDLLRRLYGQSAPSAGIVSP
jgi:tRNA nucleotidyltransferase (CCA-adding enzyme)